MFTNKLKAKWGRYTQKEKKYMLYNICWEKKLSPWILHWLCISHPKPWGGQRAGACVVSSSEMAGGNKKGGKMRKNWLIVSNRHVCVCVFWGRRNKCMSVRGGWYFLDIQKRQDPVSKHLFRLKSEWAALKRATELSQAFFVVFFFSSIPLSGRAPTSSLSPIWCYLCQQAGWFMVMEGRWWGEEAQWPFPRPPSS